MAIDLSSLEGFDSPLPSPAGKPAAEEKPSGKPLEVPLADIEEDPHQPRQEFDADAMEEMTASVKATGVISPVSLRPHPTRPGAWILNHGARRYRASVAAGKATIPAFVDEKHDDYDQVIENLLRDDLTPLEVARFIQRKLDEGDAKSKIAKRLSRSAKFITIHLALVDPPASVSEAYAQGKTKSPEIIYNLRALAEKHPEQVSEWIADRDEITRHDVSQLTEELTGKKKGGAGEGPKASPEGADAGGGKSGGLSTEKIPGDDSGSEGGEGEGGQGGDRPPVQQLPPHNPAHEKALTNKGKDDPDAIKKAVLIVVYDDRPAMVLLNRRPSTQGLLHIKYEDNGEEVEVDAGRCKINCLIEASA
ncbi:ParB/RepB/Spo0J family partition protein [Xanthomonas axonopodis]|uniref:ParB/RepB/Spo0J family partition protein n=1 Tax=Xanthomonas axonopodis TaxID=53413 RepID=UPI003557D502